MMSISVSVGSDKKDYMINDNLAVKLYQQQEKTRKWVGNNDHNIKSSKSI